MKISKQTLDILKNFSIINQSMLIRPGNTQRTIRIPQRNVLAEAFLSEEFPVECGIYELPKFLAAITLFEEPELEFGSCYVDINDTNSENKIRYYYAAANLFKDTQPPDKRFVLDEVMDEFTLDNSSLTKLNKAAMIMSIPDFVINRKDNKRTISVCNIKSKSSNTFTVTQKSDIKGDYNVILNNDNLKCIPDSYAVTVGIRKGITICQFSSNNITYWFGPEI